MIGETAVDPYLRDFDTDLFDPEDNVVYEIQKYNDAQNINLTKKDSETTTYTQSIFHDDFSISIYKSQFANPADAIVSFPSELLPTIMSQEIAEGSKNVEDSSETTNISWIEPKVLNKDSIRKMPKKVPGTYIMTHLNILIAITQRFIIRYVNIQS